MKLHIPLSLRRHLDDGPARCGTYLHARSQANEVLERHIRRGPLGMHPEAIVISQALAEDRPALDSPTRELGR